MDYLLTFTILSLFLPIRLQTGFVLLRPFGPLVVMLLIALLVKRRRNIVLPMGLLLLLPFLAWDVISALTGGVENGLREFFQIAVVSMFAFALAQESGRLDPGKVVLILLWGMAAVMAYTIGWHLANGYWAGWKHLTDPKLTFTFLPVVLAGRILFATPADRRGLWLAWALLFPILIFSGERKALLIYLLLSAALMGRGRIALILPPAIAGFAGLFVLASVMNNPYVEKQLNTLVDPMGTGRYEYLIETGTFAPGSTPSDAQRAFALKRSEQLIAEHPFFGVGTNQYKNILDTQFRHLPGELRLAIHGEFQRVLTENGIIGFAFYLLVWFASWFRLRRLLCWAWHHRLVTASQRRLLPLIVFVPCALYVGTEASGTRAFIGLILISLFPELASHGLHMAASAVRLNQRSWHATASPLVGHSLPRSMP
jgi:hypothetical protein